MMTNLGRRLVGPNPSIEIARPRIILPGQMRQRGYVGMQVLESDGTLALDPMTGKIRRWWYKNAATTAGLNYLLGVGFNSVTQITAWYLGLINGDTFTSVSANDTMSSHPNWAEDINYSGGNRPAWTVGTIASGSAPTGTAASYTITGDTEIQGIFIASSQAQNATTGTLWATAVEGSPRSVSNGQTLQVFYTNTLTPVS